MKRAAHGVRKTDAPVYGVPHRLDELLPWTWAAARQQQQRAAA